MQTFTVPAHRPPLSNLHPANDEVSTDTAHLLFESQGIDWPVSGDDTVMHYGVVPSRRAARRVNIWNGTGVQK